MQLEKRALQVAVALACLVPLTAGGAGMILGPDMIAGAGDGIALDSHFRYLSGLLFGIGLAFASTVPRIEKQSARFFLLTCIVVVGGMGRWISVLILGAPSKAMAFALAMELVVTPCLALWQYRVSRQV